MDHVLPRVVGILFDEAGVSWTTARHGGREERAAFRALATPVVEVPVGSIFNAVLVSKQRVAALIGPHPHQLQVPDCLRLPDAEHTAQGQELSVARQSRAGHVSSPPPAGNHAPGALCHEVLQERAWTARCFQSATGTWFRAVERSCGNLVTPNILPDSAPVVNGNPQALSLASPQTASSRRNRPATACSVSGFA